ncbi:MAG: hypothetical protein HYX20_02305 [Candidatus Yanofskybacteria bacterium]|nr:hypothetical protein [Candidatus Yanofskybacteria bacterium]
MNFDNLSSEELKKLLTMGRTSGKRMAFEFWLKHIELIAPRETGIGKDQQHYTARFLTRFSLVSTTHSMFHFPTFMSLAQIYDEFVQDIENQYSPEPMEIAGYQTLLLGGFYLKAASKHYNMEDIRKMGELFFTRGAIGKRKSVIKKMAHNFSRWQNTLCYLEWYLRNERLVIQKAEKPDEPLIKIIPR